MQSHLKIKYLLIIHSYWKESVAQKITALVFAVNVLLGLGFVFSEGSVFTAATQQHCDKGVNILALRWRRDKKREAFTLHSSWEKNLLKEKKPVIHFPPQIYHITCH